MLSFLRRYPTATVALLGLALGLPLQPTHPEWARYAFLLVLLVGGLPLAFQNIKSIAQRKFSVDLIATLSVLGSLATGQYLAGALVVLMQSGGEALEDYGMRQANKSLDNLLRRAPSTAQRREADGGFAPVAVADICVGDLLLARPGDILAADGVVREGNGSVDESALTGEPVPLAKGPGERVYSGTINLSGSFLYEATQAAAQSKYERIVRLVQQAQGERAPIVRLADRYTPPFTALTVFLTALTYFLTHDPHRTLAVLVVATPCPLIIATPLAVLSAINRAAALNIIAKSGAGLETLARIDTVVFDKTGTLTVGKPQLTEVLPLSAALAPQTILSYCAAIEAHSSHALAQSVQEAARAQHLAPQTAAELIETPGKGIAGTVAGHRVALGSGGFLGAEGVSLPASAFAQRTELNAQGKMVAFVAIDTEPVALLVFADTLRPEATTLLDRLRQLGLTRLILLTGDAPAAAQAAAAPLGIPTVIAGIAPDGKLGEIERLEKEGATVLMVGDGINDAPALAAAAVSIAMGDHGAGIATDAADLVITVENVERVADSVVIGRRMVAIAKQGIFLGIGVSTVLMLLATRGWISPPVGALLQELLDLGVIVNALRARR